MQGTTYEVHQLNDAGEPVRFRAGFSVHPGDDADTVQAIASHTARKLASDEGKEKGVFMRSFERVSTVTP